MDLVVIFLLGVGDLVDIIQIVLMFIFQMDDFLEVDSNVVPMRILHTLHLTLDVAQVRTGLAYLVLNDVVETTHLILYDTHIGGRRRQSRGRRNMEKNGVAAAEETSDEQESRWIHKEEEHTIE